MNKHLKEDEEELSNREKVLRPRKEKFYCICDMAMVGIYKKCPKCGARNNRKRYKN